MMNDPFVIQSSRELARAALGESQIENDRIGQLWRRALSRPPTGAETTAAVDFLQALQSEYLTQRTKAIAISNSIESLKSSIAGLLDPVRERLLAERSAGSSPKVDLKPLAAWDFAKDGKDMIGNLHCELHDGARIEDGSLVLDGSGWASTGKLPADLSERSLEATVMLTNEKQRGGGVLTIQTLNGHTFDAIVIGEQQERHWLAGSDTFSRTERFNGPPETEAKTTPVHLLMTYSSGGATTLYRNGEKYGSFNKGLQHYKGSNSQILFGMRHGTARVGGRMLNGKILQARLYARAPIGRGSQGGSIWRSVCKPSKMLRIG